MNRYILTIFGLLLIIMVQVSFIKNETTSKEELGKLLFFDPVLSKDYTISCASCHKPGHAFADTTAVSRGVARRKGSRNTPSAMNVSLQRRFWPAWRITRGRALPALRSSVRASGPDRRR